jgi:coiled-coil domain-containing protein 55
MKKLKFGLNVKRKNIFSQEEDTKEEPVDHKRKFCKAEISRQELEIVQDALDQDADIFEYDKNYSKFNHVNQKKKQDKESRYIKNLLKVSEKRKIELEIAKEKKIQKELEEEGHMFADKEKFVTQGYADKLKELADKEKDLEEENSEKNIHVFYRNLLFSPHSEQSELCGKVEQEETQQEEIQQEKEEEHLQGNVIKNDSEEIIDKRLYLKGGLNFTKKKRENIPISRGKEPTVHTFKKNIRNQQLSELDFRKQKEEIQKRKLEEIQQKREKLEKEQESKISQKQVIGAKERYLQRKKLLEKEQDQL